MYLNLFYFNETLSSNLPGGTIRLEESLYLSSQSMPVFFARFYT